MRTCLTIITLGCSFLSDDCLAFERYSRPEPQGVRLENAATKVVADKLSEAIGLPYRMRINVAPNAVSAKISIKF